MSPGLVVRGLVAGWDRPAVVRDADLEAEPGEIVALLGANGAGKSTLLWALAGLLRPRAGTVEVDGRRVDGLAAERVASAGMRLLPQARRIFPSLSVRENLEVVDLAGGRPDRRALASARQAWLDRHPALAQRLDEPAAALSGGQQQLLAIGRVVATRPRVLLLDEPSAGLAVGVAEECAATFGELAADGVAIVLVEQNVALARRLATRTLELRDGRPIPPGDTGTQDGPNGGQDDG